jgi:CxxC-x17-CxxC domain-containing protein|tara:strand:+ start:2146 stop:2637 length:492 start_codon:yes stop_codon:yes gene_type:complete
MGDFDRNAGSSRRRSGGSRGRDSGRFDRRGSGRFDRGDRGRDRRSERHEMHSAICDKCGKDCEVPFKPTQGKPIYCSDCFKNKSKEAGSRSEFGKPIDNANLDKINEKLNRILKILESKTAIGKPKKTKEEKPKKIEEEPKLEYAGSVEKKKPKKKKAKKKKS